MKPFFHILLLLLLSARLHAADSLPLDEHLKPLEPFIGKTWRGEFKGSTPEKPIIDISRWERALNGKAIKITHSINDGAYGGESFIRWDDAKKELLFFYFTTAGFYTTGAMKVENGKIMATEKVNGRADGATEVRSTYELRPDGTLLNKSEYLAGEKVAGSREVLYKPAPEAKVMFR
jgi:hypothetical protein